MTLNPVHTIGVQMAEAVTAHAAMDSSAVRDLCCQKLEQVGIAEPEARLRAYPHEFSGGMRQRVAIAIALLNKPELIIADEPTTALDVTIQAQIVAEVEDLCRSTGTALLWVTHDLGLVSSFADRVCVMYAGRIVEEGRVDQVLSAPRHPYTHGLLASIPSRHRRGEALFRMPDAQGPAPQSGCAFINRCPRPTEQCKAPLQELELENERRVLCVNPL